MGRADSRQRGPQWRRISVQDDHRHPPLGIPDPVVGVGKTRIAWTGRRNQLAKFGVVVAEPGHEAPTFAPKAFDLILSLAAGLGQRLFDHARVTADALDLLDHESFNLARWDGGRRAFPPASLFGAVANVIPVLPGSITRARTFLDDAGRTEQVRNIKGDLRMVISPGCLGKNSSFFVALVFVQW